LLTYLLCASERGDAVADQAVAFFHQLLFGNAEAVQINFEPPVVQHLRRNKTPAAARADARDVAVHVHDAAGNRLDRKDWPRHHAPDQPKAAATATTTASIPADNNFRQRAAKDALALMFSMRRQYAKPGADVN
jgi:hypothetical protein